MDAFRNYDAWKTASPYDDYWDEDYPPYRCEECGAFLKTEPERSVCGEQTNQVEDFDGEMITEKYTWVDHHRTCKKCGHDNVETDA